MSALEEMRQRSNVVMDHPGHVTICMSQADVPALLGALDAVLALADSLHDPSVIQYSFHMGSDLEYNASKAQIARRIRAAVNDALEAS